MLPGKFRHPRLQIVHSRAYFGPDIVAFWTSNMGHPPLDPPVAEYDKPVIALTLCLLITTIVVFNPFVS